MGIRRIPLSRVTECFTGVALELAPTSSLTPSKAVEAVPLGTFLPAFRGLGSSLAGVFVMTLALQAFALALPLNVQFTIDQGVRQGDEGTAHLNDELQGRVLDNLRATGATIVAASHDERVLARADRRVVLTQAGR